MCFLFCDELPRWIICIQIWIQLPSRTTRIANVHVHMCDELGAGGKSTIKQDVSVGAQARLDGMVVCNATLGCYLMIGSGWTVCWILDFAFVIMGQIWFKFLSSFSCAMNRAFFFFLLFIIFGGTRIHTQLCHCYFLFLPKWRTLHVPMCELVHCCSGGIRRWVESREGVLMSRARSCATKTNCFTPKYCCLCPCLE